MEYHWRGCCVQGKTDDATWPVVIDERTHMETVMSAANLLALSLGVATLATAILAPAAHAAELQPIHRLPAAVASHELSTRLGLEAGSQLQPRSEAATVHSTRTVRLQQTWHGIPVHGQVLTVEQDHAGRTLQAYGNVARDLRFDLPAPAAKLRRSQAIAALMQRDGLSASAKREASQQSATLYVLIDNGRARLSYLTSYFSEAGGRATRRHAFIDADSGAVIEQWDGLAHFDAEGPGGNERIGKYYYGRDGKPFLDVTRTDALCTMENANAVVLNYNNSNTPSKYTFTCPVSLQPTFNDAHHWGNAVVRMYQAYVGQRPFPGQMRIGLNRPASDKCSWNGARLGCGSDGNTVPTLDMLGHEASHAYTELNSGLVYAGQSGGINESFSDIGGEASEYFDRGLTDFVVGAELFAEPDRGLRWMCDPKRDGKSIDQLADYTEGMDVHRSSGLYNKTFCTLARSTGWDAKKAFRTFARANDLYWVANESFPSAAPKVVRAACDLGYPAVDVIASFRGVGINAGSNPCAVLPVKADFDYTVTGLTSAFVDRSTGPIARRSWSFGDGTTSTEADPVHVYGAAGTFSVTLTVTDEQDVSDSKTQSVTVANRDDVLSNNVPVPASGKKGEQRFYTFDLKQAAAEVRFSLSGGSGDGDLYVKFASAPTTRSYDCRPYHSGNNEQCTLPGKVGTYHVMLHGYTDFSGAHLLASASACAKECGPDIGNQTDFPVADLSTVESPASASAASGNGSAASRIAIAIKHPFSGDLIVELIAADDTSYMLHNRTGGSSDNIEQTYTLDLSSEPRAGTWTLRVRDAARGDSGVLDGWSLNF